MSLLDQFAVGEETLFVIGLKCFNHILQLFLLDIQLIVQNSVQHLYHKPNNLYLTLALVKLMPRLSNY